MPGLNRVPGKIAVVVGGGSSHSTGGHSNGQAAALTYSREGAKVAVVDVSLRAAQQTVDEILSEGGEAFALEADVCDSTALKRMADAVCARWFRIDISHNNVGIVAFGTVVTTSEEDWDRVHDVNLKGVFLACKHIIPIMARNGGGAIVNISTVSSLRYPQAVQFVAYNSSKAALNHLTQVMARQHARDRVRVNAVIPGLMDTPHIRTLYRDMSEQELATKLAERDARCPLGRQGNCWDVANASLFLASDEASYVPVHCWS